jgi:RNA polymerase sigma-70 factor (ECF subfamily)
MKDQLALRIKRADEQAFELLFRKYHVRLCRFANKYSNDPDEAREIVQEVFVKIWEEKENIDPEASLVAYLFKITQNICLNRLRHNKVKSKYIEIYKLVYTDYSEVSPYESLLAKELEDYIPIILCKIPPKCRKIFELSRVDGLKYHEIAEVLQISIKTVEAQMSKALQILRLGLKDYLGILIFYIIIIFRS